MREGDDAAAQKRGLLTARGNRDGCPEIGCLVGNVQTRWPDSEETS